MWDTYRTLARKADSLLRETSVELSPCTREFHSWTGWTLAVHELMEFDAHPLDSHGQYERSEDLFLDSALALSRIVDVYCPTQSDDPPDDLVTLDQAAGMVGQSKRTLERYLSKRKLPPPDLPGGGGTAHRWYWSTIRPALEEHCRPNLPAKFPASRII